MGCGSSGCRLGKSRSRLVKVSPADTPSSVTIALVEWKVHYSSVEVLANKASLAFSSFKGLEPGNNLPDFIALHMMELLTDQYDDALYEIFTAAESEGFDVCCHFASVVQKYTSVVSVLRYRGSSAHSRRFVCTDMATMAPATHKRNSNKHVLQASFEVAPSSAGGIWQKIVLLAANLHSREPLRLKQINEDGVLYQENGDIEKARPLRNSSLRKSLQTLKCAGDVESKFHREPAAWILWGDLNHRLDWLSLQHEMWEASGPTPIGARSAPSTNGTQWRITDGEADWIIQHLCTSSGRQRLLSHDTLTGMPLSRCFGSAQILRENILGDRGFSFVDPWCDRLQATPLPSYKRKPGMDHNTLMSTDAAAMLKEKFFNYDAGKGTQMELKNEGRWMLQMGWLDRLGWATGRGVAARLRCSSSVDSTQLGDHALAYWTNGPQQSCS